MSGGYADGGYHGPVLAYEKTRYWYGRSYEILAVRYGNSGPGVFIVRPEENPGKPNELRIYISETGWVMVLSDNRVLVAYNPTTNLGYGTANSDKEIADVSPFVLLGSKASLHPPDIKDLKESITTGDAEIKTLPKEKHLQIALNHPNPKARILARELLEFLKSKKRGNASLSEKRDR